MWVYDNRVQWEKIGNEVFLLFCIFIIQGGVVKLNIAIKTLMNFLLKTQYTQYENITLGYIMSCKMVKERKELINK